MEACLEAQQIMEGIVACYVTDASEQAVTEEQFKEEFIKVIDQRCQHTTTQEWNRIAMTCDMMPSELAAKILAMVDAVKHQHPVDQNSLIRKFCNTIPAHHTAITQRIQLYLHEDKEHTLQELARQAHYVYSQVATERSFQEMLES